MTIATMNARSSRLPQIMLWIGCAVLALPLTAAGLPKLLGLGGWVGMFGHWGYPAWLVPIVGASEVLGVALLFIPGFASIGAAMIAIVMAGAALTHATHGEGPRVVFTSILCSLALLIGWARLTRLRWPVVSRAVRSARHSPERS